ncbi:hypothetical protein P3W45_001432 [Vairimorpha bombi]|jgi:hypothetical protein
MIRDRLTFEFLFDRSYKLEHFNITCNDYNTTTKMFCFGTQEGSLLFTQNNFDEVLNDTNSKFKILSRNITDTEIHSVSWLNDITIGCTHADSVYSILDIITDKISLYDVHTGSVKYIKKTGANIFYTCGRDKSAKGWDIRSMEVFLDLKHEGSVTCLEVNRRNDKILYTTSTPGTIIHYWDTRYTKRGAYYASTKSISNFYCRDLIYYGKNLYSKNKISQIHKISESCKQKSLFIDKQIKSYCGSIDYNSKYDCLFTTIDEELFSITETGTKKIKINEALTFNGCICYNEETVVLHNNQEIRVYYIRPYIE